LVLVKLLNINNKNAFTRLNNYSCLFHLDKKSILKMGEQMKKLVLELNKPPYNKNYNLISFDSLSGEQLLQNLSDVMAEIDAKNQIDIREEEPETTILRILGMLRILKYKPPMEISQNFRQGLVEGQRMVI
jgi:intraflagellar transport protein 81